MPVTLEKIEFGIYCLYASGTSGYDEVLESAGEAIAGREDAGETHQVFIINREAESEVRLNFNEIRQIVSQQDIRKSHYLHIDTGTAIRVTVAGINRVTPLNIQMVQDMELAVELGRDILSRYTQPRRKKKDEQN